MLNLNHPLRYRNDRSKKLVYIGTHVTAMHNKLMLIALSTDKGTGKVSVIYRNPDGGHPDYVNHSSYDIVNIDTTVVASLYQTIDSDLAKALKTLWKHDQFGPAIDVMIGLEPSLNKHDIEDYFSALF